MSEEKVIPLQEVFAHKKEQYRVAKFLLQQGISISSSKKLLGSGVEIPYSSVAKVLGVDRRVVKDAVNTILENKHLAKIFTKLSSIPLLRDIANELGFGAIEVIAEDPSSKGLAAAVTKIIAEAGLSIRQITTDDPMFEHARMIVITQKPLPRELIDEILKVKGVGKVTVLC